MGRKALQQQRPATVTRTVTEAAAAIETVTNVKQSIEILQTLVHGSISSLLFLRKLLPASCFVEQSYAAIKSHGTYEQYASGLGVRENMEPEKYPGWSFKSLRRGKSTRADRLLDWLVSGPSSYDTRTYHIIGEGRVRCFAERLSSLVAAVDH
jgi:hypothetical protein